MGRGMSQQHASVKLLAHKRRGAGRAAVDLGLRKITSVGTPETADMSAVLKALTRILDGPVTDPTEPIYLNWERRALQLIRDEPQNPLRTIAQERLMQWAHVRATYSAMGAALLYEQRYGAPSVPVTAQSLARSQTHLCRPDRNLTLCGKAMVGSANSTWNLSTNMEPVEVTCRRCCAAAARRTPRTAELDANWVARHAAMSLIFSDSWISQLIYRTPPESLEEAHSRAARQAVDEVHRMWGQYLASGQPATADAS